MKFTPFKFQIPLAAGGVALMAFNYLQFAVPHGKGLVTLSDITWAAMTPGQTYLYAPLMAIMLAFTLVNLGLTAIYVKDLFQWIANKEEYRDFINSPPTKNVGVFAPVASLSMTASVIFAPLGFFVPQLSSNLQALMLPGLIFFALLWLAVFGLEFMVLKTWLSRPLDVTRLNFVWLLDVFAFGLVSLTGTGIAAMSGSEEIASIAAFASLFTLTAGFFLLVTKLAYLVYLQIKADKLPDTPVLPAFFLIIPITCLFGFSCYRITLYLQKYFSYDMKTLSFLLINLSYVIAIGWGVFCLYLLSNYFRRDFYRSDFSPTQWGMV